MQRLQLSIRLLGIGAVAGAALIVVPPMATTTNSAPQTKARPKLAARGSFRDCPDCPEMVVVPAGAFTMGSPQTEAGRDPYEGPQHTVTIGKPFAAGQFAVTFAEWDACVAGGGCGSYKPDDKRWGRGDRPVINVSWNEAKAYTAWLSQKTGQSYRLLSEAEREYAARSGALSPFWWGPAVTTDQANFDPTAEIRKGGGVKGEYRRMTLPVKSFVPNGFGLYQVHGNVWEWVEDCWHDNYEGAPGDGTAWTGEQCSRRVLRGGAWGSPPRSLRAAARTMYFQTLRDSYTGFRVARPAAM